AAHAGRAHARGADRRPWPALSQYGTPHDDPLRRWHVRQRALAPTREPRAWHQRPAGADRRAARDHAGDAAQRRRRCGGVTGSSSRPSAAAGAPARLRRSAASGETCAARWPRLPSSTTLLIERDVLIPTRDGGAVCANVFRPEGAGEFPVIITMGPYPKDI